MSGYRILDGLAGGGAASVNCALGVMVKAPLAGKVKTRLVPPLLPEEAAKLNVAFLRDTVESIASVPADARCQGVAIYTPAGSEDAFDRLLPEGFCLIAQRGDGFGERLFNAASDLLQAGFASVCLIDSDSPTLPSAVLVEAAKRLAAEGDRVVLGAAADGGYYLIGVKANHPELFSNIDWSTNKVFSQTMERARSIGLAAELLPVWYDVDDASSLSRLCEELFPPGAIGRSNGNGLSPYAARHTRAYLSDLLAQEALRKALGR